MSVTFTEALSKYQLKRKMMLETLDREFQRLVGKFLRDEELQKKVINNTLNDGLVVHKLYTWEAHDSFEYFDLFVHHISRGKKFHMDIGKEHPRFKNCIIKLILELSHSSSRYKALVLFLIYLP